MLGIIRKRLGLDFKNSRQVVFYLTFTAMMAALYVVIDRFLTIQATNMLKLPSLSFVPVVISAVVLGPVSGSLVCGLGDLIGSVAFPKGDPIIMLTVNCFIMGFIYGLFLYSPDSTSVLLRKRLSDDPQKSKKLNFVRFLISALIAIAVNKFFMSLVCNTFVLAAVFSPENVMGFARMSLPARALKELLAFVLEAVMIPLMIPLYSIVAKAGRLTSARER